MELRSQCFCFLFSILILFKSDGILTLKNAYFSHLKIITYEFFLWNLNGGNT